MRNIIFSAAMIAAGFASAPAYAFKFPETGNIPIPQSKPVAGMRTVIDKSCLMICEQWGESDCSKWVMKCKGDSGYPAGSVLQR